MFDTFFGMRASSDADARVVQRFVGEDDVPENAKEEKGMVPFCIPEGFGNALLAMEASVGAGDASEDLEDWESFASKSVFSFILTKGDGERAFGFCQRHIVPKGGKVQIQAYCFISRHAYYSLFFEVLARLSRSLLRLGVPAAVDAQPQILRGEHHEFLAALRRHGPASPAGVPFHIPTSLLPSGSLALVRPADSLGQGEANADVPLAPLLYRLPVAPFVSLLAALLHERRIVVTSRNISSLSNAVTAAAAIIWPFRWSHITLPVLPITLIDYLTAPMPFLIGVPHTMLPQMAKMPCDEIFILDIDSGTCELPNGDNGDAEGLPSKPRKKLFEDLTAIRDTLPTGLDRLVWGRKSQGTNGPIVSALRNFFLAIFAGYRRFVREDYGEVDGANGSTGALAASGLWFDQEAFLASTRSARTRSFLDNFRHSQMFEVFVTERLCRMKDEAGGMDEEIRAERDAFDEEHPQPVNHQVHSSRHLSQHRRSFSSRVLRSFYQSTEIRPVQKSSSSEYGSARWVESVHANREQQRDRVAPTPAPQDASVDGDMGTSQQSSVNDMQLLSMSDSEDDMSSGPSAPGSTRSLPELLSTATESGAGPGGANGIERPASWENFGSEDAPSSNGHPPVSTSAQQQSGQPASESAGARDENDPGKALSIALGLLDMDGDQKEEQGTGATQAVDAAGSNSVASLMDL